MKWDKKWQAIRHHLFVGVTLLGCTAPWVTPRHFPIHSVILKTQYETIEDRGASLIEVSETQMEVVQNAC